jgi:hypothetical protein
MSNKGGKGPMGHTQTEEESKMKTKLIFAAILAVLALGPPVTTFAYLTSDEQQTLLDNLSTAEAAKALVVDLYTGTGNTVVAAAPFQLRTVNGEGYLVTKAFITLSSGGQIVVGVVDDFNRQWTHAITVNELNYFLRTGDRTVLKEPDLNLPPQSSPHVPQRQVPQVEAGAFIVGIEAALNDHDWRTITSFTQNGQVNYFGHRYSSNAYIIRDMENDASTYSWSHSNYYPETFTHEVSNEYSARWNGPMIYDSINVYSEIQERHGRLHRALTRLTVGYTVEDDVIGDGRHTGNSRQLPDAFT